MSKVESSDKKFELASLYLKSISGNKDLIYKEYINLREFAFQWPLKVDCIVFSGFITMSCLNFLPDFRAQDTLVHSGLRLLKLAANLGKVESAYYYASTLNKLCDEKDVVVLATIKQYYEFAASNGCKRSQNALDVLFASTNHFVSLKNYDSLIKSFERVIKELQDDQSKYLYAKLLCKIDFFRYKDRIYELLSSQAEYGHVNAVNLYIDCLKKDTKKSKNMEMDRVFNKFIVTPTYEGMYFADSLKNALPDLAYYKRKDIMNVFDLKFKKTLDKINEVAYASALYSQFKTAVSDEKKSQYMKMAKEVLNLFVLSHSDNTEDVQYAADFGDVASLKKILEVSKNPEERFWILERILIYKIELTGEEIVRYEDEYLSSLLKKTLNTCGLESVRFIKEELIEAGFARLNKKFNQIIKKYKAKVKAKARKSVEEESPPQKEDTQKLDLVLSTVNEKETSENEAVAVVVPDSPVSADLVVPAMLLETTEKQLTQNRRHSTASAVLAQGSGGGIKEASDVWGAFKRFEDSTVQINQLFPPENNHYVDGIVLKLSRQLYLNTGVVKIAGVTLEGVSHISIGNRAKKDGVSLFGYLNTPNDSRGNRDINNQTFKPICVAQHISSTTYVIKACDLTSGIKCGQVIVLR